MKRCCVVLCLLLGGCSLPGGSSEPEFRRVYEELASRVGWSRSGAADGPRMTLSADAMPLSNFLRYVADKTGVSVAAEAQLDSRPVTVEVQEEPVSKVLGVVARRLGVQVTRSGSMYYLGSLRPEDRGVLVRRVCRLDREGLNQAVEALLSDIGRTVSYEDGLLVVADRVEVLERVNELLDGVESADNSSWVVQLYLIQISDTDALDLGFEQIPSLDVAYTFAATSDGLALGDSTASLELVGGLQAVLRASRERSGVRLVAEPLFIIEDGGVARFVQGESIPVVQRSVSEVGTVVDTGYSSIQTGLQVEVRVRESSRAGARLAVQVRNSWVTRMVGNLPATDERSFDTAVPLVTGGVYLLGCVGRRDESAGRSGVFGALFKRSRVQSSMHVWARVYRVSGPVRSVASRPEG